MSTYSATKWPVVGIGRQYRAAKLIREREVRAQVILLQELFETPYFCKDTTLSIELALPLDGHPRSSISAQFARELEVVRHQCVRTRQQCIL